MMPDREKVIKGLECCKTYGNCNECPYDGTEQNCNNMRREALTLIKELIDGQPSVKPKKTKGYNPPMYTIYEYDCENCGSPMMTKQPYCMGCGRAVKWE